MKKLLAVSIFSVLILPFVAWGQIEPPIDTFIFVPNPSFDIKGIILNWFLVIVIIVATISLILFKIKKQISRLLPILMLFILTLLFIFLSRISYVPPCPPGFSCNIQDLITTDIINWFSSIALIITIVFLVIGAISFIISHTKNPAKYKTTRNMLICAIVSMAIAVLAKGLLFLYLHESLLLLYYLR